MGASLRFSSNRETRVGICVSQERSSVRLPDALSPRARAISRSASRVRRGGDLARVRGISPLFYAPLGVKLDTENTGGARRNTEKSLRVKLWISQRGSRRYAQVVLRAPPCTLRVLRDPL